jgi:hypothetical protein
MQKRKTKVFFRNSIWPKSLFWMCGTLGQEKLFLTLYQSLLLRKHYDARKNLIITNLPRK